MLFRSGLFSKSLCGTKNAFSEKVKLRSAISLSFDQLETGNLAFGLPLAPGEIEPSANSGLITPKSSGKASEFWGQTPRGLLDP